MSVVRGDCQTSEADDDAVVSEYFSSPHADLRLRSADGVVFHVFSCILTEASPVFLDMVSLPKSEQNPITSSSVNLTEDAETLDLILRFTYPIPEPSVTDFGVLKRLLKAADKYSFEGLAQSMRRILVSSAFTDQEPLRAFALACQYGFEPEAKELSKRCLKMDILTQAELYDELAMISGKDLLRLIKLHQTRAASILSILNGSGPSPCTGSQESTAAGSPIWWMEFKRRATEEIRTRPVSEFIFQPTFLAQCVNVAVAGGCAQCALNFVSPATQARLASLRERIDALPNSV